jgi:hypothetical protein
VPQQPIAQAEWNTHPHIQSRYNTWQAYESVRNRVAGWRNPPVADPASYIDSAIVEWNANPGMHRDFDNNFDGDPHRSYLNLKRLYQNRGINNPANFLATNIVNITFYNRRTPGHTDLQVALNNAQTAMTAAGHTFVLDAGTWSYVPRTFNNNINSLSNHALGKAIDINPGNNPHITSSEDFLVINTLCSPVIPHGLLAETNYANLKSASDFFQQHFDDTWVSNQEHLLTQMQGQHPPPPNLQAQQRLVNAIHHRRAMLNGYAARGFLNLPADLVAGLQGAGLSWGGEWHTAKDFMHFELPNP